MRTLIGSFEFCSICYLPNEDINFVQQVVKSQSLTKYSRKFECHLTSTIHRLPFSFIKPAASTPANFSYTFVFNFHTNQLLIIENCLSTCGRVDWRPPRFYRSLCANRPLMVRARLDDALDGVRFWLNHSCQQPGCSRRNLPWLLA